MGSTLAHVMVVAGTSHDWDAVDERQWLDRAEELGAAVAAAGGAWLTMRAYERGAEGAGRASERQRAARRWGPGAQPPQQHGAAVTALDRQRRQVTVADGRCTVIIDPLSDGRERFAQAMRHLPAGVKVDEKSVASVLYEPADVEPDLVLILGPPTRLPPSLVWELAYSELVFLPARFDELRAEHLTAAVEEFHTRRRRFGGLDDG